MKSRNLGWAALGLLALAASVGLLRLPGGHSPRARAGRERRRGRPDALRAHRVRGHGRRPCGPIVVRNILAIPPEALASEDDLYGTFESARYTAQHIPGAKFISFPTGGHLWAGHHAEILSKIAAFLARSPWGVDPSQKAGRRPTSKYASAQTGLLGKKWLDLE